MLPSDDLASPADFPSLSSLLQDNMSANPTSPGGQGSLACSQPVYQTPPASQKMGTSDMQLSESSETLTSQRQHISQINQKASNKNPRTLHPAKETVPLPEHFPLSPPPTSKAKSFSFGNASLETDTYPSTTDQLNSGSVYSEEEREPELHGHNRQPYSNSVALTVRPRENGKSSLDETRGNTHKSNSYTGRNRISEICSSPTSPCPQLETAIPVPARVLSRKRTYKVFTDDAEHVQAYVSNISNVSNVSETENELNDENENEDEEDKDEDEDEILRLNPTPHVRRRLFTNTTKPSPIASSSCTVPRSSLQTGNPAHLILPTNPTVPSTPHNLGQSGLDTTPFSTDSKHSSTQSKPYTYAPCNTPSKLNPPQTPQAPRKPSHLFHDHPYFYISDPAQRSNEAIPQYNYTVSISAAELRRLFDNVMGQVDWERAAEHVASNRGAAHYMLVVKVAFEKVLRDVERNEREYGVLGV